jgi:serine/threonine-protein kinase
MGSVWRAWNMSLDLDVAVKLVRCTGVPHAGERLLKEARAAARVVHPGAVRVFDFDLTDAGDPFLVMELLSGRTLSRALRESGPLTPLEAVLLILPVLGALRVAHREGIVHRDVKPANVVLVEGGRHAAPKLIDFGIAAVAPSSWSRKLSAIGMLLGSPSYMSPEQACGGAILDVRTDVWGACTTLYETMSGARPFGGADRSSIIHEILWSAPRRPDALATHPELWEIVRRGLAKALADRWPTVDELGAALARWALAQGATWDAAGASLAGEWPC